MSASGGGVQSTPGDKKRAEDECDVCLDAPCSCHRCDACERPGKFGLCCGEHQARMCPACASVNHAGYLADSRARKRLLWTAVRDAVEHLQEAERPVWDVPSAHDADVILARLLPLLPLFPLDESGEEYHRCYCKRGYDHVSNL